MGPLQLALFMLIVCMSSASMGAHFTCKEAERNALIKFKQSFSDPSNYLGSWIGEDCCNWKGVGCDNITGNVIKLDLISKDTCLRDQSDLCLCSTSFLKAEEVTPALLELKYLTYLNLRCTSFNGSRFPEFFGSMRQLQHLDLSETRFSGKIPHNLGNLTKLVVLDLSFAFRDYNLVETDTLEWVFKLENLEYLDLSGIPMYRSLDSLNKLHNLPSLSVLNLALCELQNSHLLIRNSSTTLQHLDLSYNLFSGPVPHFIQNLTSLTFLDLSFNFFNGSFPSIIQNFSSIEFLDLSINQFGSSIPSWLATKKHLKVLRLDDNYFDGSFPRSIQNLSSLRELDLSSNQFSFSIPSWLANNRYLEYLSLSFNHFSYVDGGVMNIIAHLCSLSTLDLSFNQIQEEVSQSHTNFSCSRYDLEELHLRENNFSGQLQITGKLTSLKTLDLSHNNLETLPPFISGLSSLDALDLSNNQISVVNEASLANLSKLTKLDLSSNSLFLNLSSDWSPPFQLRLLDLPSCKMNGPFPNWILSQKYIENLDMSNTGITGPLPHNLGNAIPSLSIMRLANNHINGSIPRSLCKLESFYVLDMRNNKLSGMIPDCWVNSTLVDVDLSSNQLSGHIPNSLTKARGLQLLSLNDNSLEGELTLSLSNYPKLKVLNVGRNNLHGEIPAWSHANFPSLQILILRENRFNGIIPPHLCSLHTLHIIDLASNNLRGTIPQCFGHFQGMGSTFASPPSPPLSGSDYSVFVEGPSMQPNEWSATEVIKGEEIEYTTVLHLLVNMDLSCNNLEGVIPVEITTLPLLLGLNLSHNHLAGSIPNEIGNMHSLESLDFSYNNLSGSIPESISLIDSLSTMNFSFNNLQGQVPTGRHLQTIEDPSIYMGNPGLCGDPLPKCFNNNIGHSPTSTVIEDEEDNNKHEKMWFYLVIMLGFATGFWTVIGILVFERRWRHAYFQFAEELANWLYISVAVTIARVKGRN